MLPFVHFLVVSSHFILAFSQSAFVFGASAANVGAAKPIARPEATIIVNKVFHCDTLLAHFIDAHFARE
jgi:hypothetical protein